MWVDEIPYYRLVADQPDLEARCVKVNDKSIDTEIEDSKKSVKQLECALSMPWLPELMQHCIDKVILDSELIESFDITIGKRAYVNEDNEVINGLIGRILMQDIHQDGLK